MQLQINSANVISFGVKVKFDIYNRTMLFDSGLTTYNGGGAANVLGIAIAVQDQDGVDLAVIDWTAPQILHPNIAATYSLDLSSFNYSFLFQTYKITVAIKEQNGTIYTIPAVYKTFCQPVNINDSGYVPGMFTLDVDCVNNLLTVKEATPLTYNNQTPASVTKTGSLNYPTGTISPINFSNTPFSNSVVYTGHYGINCTTVAEYNLGDDVYMDVTYLTKNGFDISCTNHIANLMCCIVSLQQTAIKNCSTSLGQRAKQQLDSIQIPLMIGLIKEINGQDASDEAALIKKTLNCDCGSNSVSQNEVTPINPSIYSIVINGVGGTTVGAAVVTGNTKTYNVVSQVYSVVKGNTGDLAFTIAIDTSVQYNTKYKITFDYNKMAASVLTAIGLDQTLINQFNSLVNLTNINLDLTGLNGKCVIDLSSVDYFLSLKTQSNQNVVKNIVVGSTTYTAPLGLLVSNTVGIEGWLNSLGKGTYSATFNSPFINILSKGNPNSLVNMTFTMDADYTVNFQRTNKSLVAVLQAYVDYLCGLTTVSVHLSRMLGLCSFNYDGSVIQTSYNTSQNQDDFNAGIASSICNIVNRIKSLSALTCDAIKAVFQDSPNGIFGATDRIFGTLNGLCAGINDKQLANAIINAVNKYSDVKSSFCAISCATSATCPEVNNTNIQMNGSAVGFYGLTWSQQPIASQTVTIKFRLSGTTPWSTSTSGLTILPNGNISGASPFNVVNNPSAGQTYDIWVVNNCGGSGFIKQITVPTGTVYSGSYLLDNIIYNICGKTPTTLYSAVPFGAGVTIYTNVGLTIPVTGYTLISPLTTGHVWTINTSTGVVGTDTGSVCASGTSGSYILGNNSGTICNGTVQTLFTNGAFAVGLTLYLDSALTTPVTGNSFVVNMANNHIYNLNNTTGVIGVDTGLACSNNTVVVSTSMGGTQITNVTGISGFTPSPAFPLSPGQVSTGTHGAFTGAIAVVISGTPVINPSNVTLSRNGIILQCMNVTAAGTYTFNSFTFLVSDTIRVDANLGGC